MTTLLVDATKVCTMCKVEKRLDEFYPNKFGKYGRHSRCKPCGNKATVASRRNDAPAQRAKARERYRKNAAQVRATNLWSMYRITVEQYDALVQAQRGTCRICLKVPDGRGMAARLHVDHNHDTGEVRGLLCNRCNSAIGLLLEDVEIMARAIAYLSEQK